MLTTMQPCGTPAAHLRHKRAGEKPCEACLVAWREYSNRKQKERRLRDPESRRAYEREWRARDIEKSRARERADWHKLSPEKKHAKRRVQQLKKYGLTPALVEQLLAAQGERCAVCDTTEPGRKGWCIDHDHTVGYHAVRGLLCLTCNVILAMMGDTLDGVRRHQWILGIRYLEHVAPLTAARLAQLKNPAPEEVAGYAAA